MFQPTAKVICDSLNVMTGDRLTTMIIKYHRYIHSEILTHRLLSRNSSSCLHGDTLITTDMPSGKNRGKAKVRKYTIRELYNKWHNGDAKGRSMKHRLKYLNVRCLNEATHEFTHTHIVDLVYSGIKDVFKIKLKNGYTLKCTKEHRIFTNAGWQTLESMGIVLNNGLVSWNKESPAIATNGFVVSPEWLIAERDSGKTLRQIAQQNGLDEKKLRYFSEKSGIKFRKTIQTHNETFEYLDYDWLFARKSEGYTNGRIAELCNTTEDRVKHSCSKLGVSGFTGTILRSDKKRVPWNKGKTYKHKEESLVKVREVLSQRRGENSPSWKGGWRNYDNFHSSLTKWMNDVRREVLDNHQWKCAISGTNKKLELHHIDPVWHNKGRAFDVKNLIPITSDLHQQLHSNNLDLIFLEYVEQGKELTNFFLDNNIKLKVSDIGKPGTPGNSLLCRFSEIASIEYLGSEETFDMEVEQPWHNFVADGIVVHNSRAIPINKLIQNVIDDDVYPLHWGKNQKGMQAFKEIAESDIEQAKRLWEVARNNAINSARQLSDLGVHKQVVNRILEPFSTITVIVSGTEWANFFKQRCHPDAQPEIRILANEMLVAYSNSKPKKLSVGDWHIPLLDDNDNLIGVSQKLKISAGRCARVSYLNHEGKRNIEDDIALHDKLLSSDPKHLSPFEHQALVQARSKSEYFGNFRGFKQHRKFLEENDQTYLRY